jgi:hypothetical protein
MFADPNIERRENEATRLFSLFAKDNEVIATTIADDAKQIGNGEVVEILIEAPKMKIGDRSFAPAKIKVEKVNIFRKIYLAMLKILDKADYREIPFKQTICGLALIITFKVFVSK